MVYCWSTVYDAGPTVNQRWSNVFWLTSISHLGSKQEALTKCWITDVSASCLLVKGYNSYTLVPRHGWCDPCCPYMSMWVPPPVHAHPRRQSRARCNFSHPHGLEHAALTYCLARVTYDGSILDQHFVSAERHGLCYRTFDIDSTVTKMTTPHSTANNPHGWV